MYHLGEETHRCSLLVTGNGYRQVTEPEGGQLSGRHKSQQCASAHSTEREYDKSSAQCALCAHVPMCLLCPHALF